MSRKRKAADEEQRTIEQAQYAERLAALPTPAEKSALIALYAETIRAYDAAIMAGDDAAATAAGEMAELIAVRFNENDKCGCALTRDELSEATAAPRWQIPMHGQAGYFRIDVTTPQGVTVGVDIETDGRSIEAHNPRGQRFFISETGYRSLSNVLPGEAFTDKPEPVTVDAIARAAVLASMKEKGAKLHDIHAIRREKARKIRAERRIKREIREKIAADYPNGHDAPGASRQRQERIEELWYIWQHQPQPKKGQKHFFDTDAGERCSQEMRQLTDIEEAALEASGLPLRFNHHHREFNYTTPTGQKRVGACSWYDLETLTVYAKHTRKTEGNQYNTRDTDPEQAIPAAWVNDEHDGHDNADALTPAEQDASRRLYAAIFPGDPDVDYISNGESWRNAEAQDDDDSDDSDDSDEEEQDDELDEAPAPKKSAPKKLEQLSLFGD